MPIATRELGLLYQHLNIPSDDRRTSPWERLRSDWLPKNLGRLGESQHVEDLQLNRVELGKLAANQVPIRSLDPHQAILSKGLEDPLYRRPPVGPAIVNSVGPPLQRRSTTSDRRSERVAESLLVAHVGVVQDPVMTEANAAGSSNKGRWPECSKMIISFDGASSISNHSLARTARPLASCLPITM